MFLNFPSAVDGPQQEGYWSAALWETDEDDLLRPVCGGVRTRTPSNLWSRRTRRLAWVRFWTTAWRRTWLKKRLRRRRWSEYEPETLFSFPPSYTESKRCVTLNSSQSFDWSVTLNPCHTALVETVSCYLLPHWSVSAKAHHLIGWKRRCFILLPHRMQSHEAEQGKPGQLVE